MSNVVNKKYVVIGKIVTTEAFQLGWQDALSGHPFREYWELPDTGIPAQRSWVYERGRALALHYKLTKKRVPRVPKNTKSITKEYWAAKALGHVI